MKSITSIVLIGVILIFSCTDRDDNLEGLQIRVQNTTNTTFTEVIIDSLSFSDLKPDEIAFYQQYNDSILPQRVELKSDSLEYVATIDSLIRVDSTQLNLFTYQIKGLIDTTAVMVEVIKE